MTAVETVEARGDITSRDDIERLVRAFYARATTDEVIGYLFTEVARLDLEAHLPIMFSFWETVLLGVRGYSGNPMQVHLALHRLSPLRAEHFDRWLLLWVQSIEQLHRGPRADEAKAKARAIARSMQLRLGAVQVRLA